MIDLVLFNIFYAVGLGFLFSRVLAILIALNFNFIFNRNVTFGARNGKVGGQVVKYIVIYSIANLANVLVGLLIVGAFGDNVLVGNIAAITGVCVSIPISFFGSLLWAFNGK